MSHKDKVREEFTRQASAFAASPAIRDEARLRRLVEAVDPAAQARMLDVATGPGYLAIAFAERCREVVGIDLTEALLEIAERMRRERGLSHVRFQRADAERLPFADQEFDVVVSRFAFHHFEDPSRPLREMVRVCCPGGVVAVEDITASERPEQAAFHNHVERLRDSSHTRALPVSELLALLAAQGLEVQSTYRGQLEQGVERWLENTQTPAALADEVRALLARDLVENLSGLRLFRKDGELFFIEPTLALVARKPGARQG